MTEKELHNIRATISYSLVSRRKELGITQEELADISSMGIATIRRFESGKFWLNLKQYVILCHHLQCSPFVTVIQ